MEIVSILCGTLLGVLLYRLGRKEGEAGRVLPMMKVGKKRRESDALLDKIEKYQGK